MKGKMSVNVLCTNNTWYSMTSGYSEQIIPEYIRHETTGIISYFAVATGKIVAPMIQKT